MSAASIWRLENTFFCSGCFSGEHIVGINMFVRGNLMSCGVKNIEARVVFKELHDTAIKTVDT